MSGVASKHKSGYQKRKEKETHKELPPLHSERWQAQSFGFNARGIVCAPEVKF